jgi:Tol biopolymer transport system component/tRNA A-37 threonylcarbamoyl transferase component Bud32
MGDVIPQLTASLANRYLIERELGQGGMATVYLAQDVRHDRKVALKVLRPELAAVIGAERFLAEIKTTANLQHPHILALFDSGEAGGFVFYVMPYVEGESLRDRLAREKQLPVEDAVRIAREVADALDYAHRHGVVHRDIKPENILLHDGRALVADFGIALAVSRSDGGTRMTETGMSLGTPHYMSPEQAMGEREITVKSDVYALGCVTYEMLVGEPPFTGPTAQSIVARVMTEAPRSLQLQRRTIPTHVEAAVQRALEKLPADRFQSAAEFGTALNDPRYASRITVTTLAQAPSSRWGRPWATPAMLGAAAILGVLAVWGWIRPRPETPTTWNYVRVGDTLSLPVTFPGLAISPDGNSLIVGDDRQNGLLWLQRRGGLDAVPIPGTERATNPVFSPDGEWVAFVAEGRLRKVRPSVGGVVTINDSASGVFGGPTWLDDGSIVYVSPNLYQLRRVGSGGGVGTVVGDASGLAGRGIGQPTPLPDARGVLHIGCASGCTAMGIYVLDLRTGEHRLLIDDASRAWYLPTGHLLYLRRDGTALAAPFDLDKLEITGEAIPVLENVLTGGGGIGALTFSQSGRMAYIRVRGSAQGQVEVHRIGNDGTVSLIDTAWYGGFNSLALSSDGRRAAIGAGLTTGGLGIWIKQLDKGPFTRLTFGGNDRRPAWSPDGRTVAFIRDTLATSIVMARDADGSSPERPMPRIDRQVQEVTWSPDGQWLLYRTDDTSPGAGDIVGVRLSGDTTPVPLAESRFTELHPAVSPDGRWLAYTSNESGSNEVYVRPFPASSGGRWQVSVQGGQLPRWSRDGKRLYYVDQRSDLIAAEIAATPSFEVTRRETRFGNPNLLFDLYHQAYEVLPRDQGIMALAIRATGSAGNAPRLVLVENWFADLKAKLGK